MGIAAELEKIHVTPDALCEASGIGSDTIKGWCYRKFNPKLLNREKFVAGLLVLGSSQRTITDTFCIDPDFVFAVGRSLLQKQTRLSAVFRRDKLKQYGINSIEELLFQRFDCSDWIKVGLNREAIASHLSLNGLNNEFLGYWIYTIENKRWDVQIYAAMLLEPLDRPGFSASGRVWKRGCRPVSKSIFGSWTGTIHFNSPRQWILHFDFCCFEEYETPIRLAVPLNTSGTITLEKPNPLILRGTLQDHQPIREGFGDFTAIRPTSTNCGPIHR
jgi:hypothetical protein